MTIQLRKSTGDTQAFSPAKLQRSLRRAGATAEQARAIVQQLPLHEMRSTADIHAYALAQLKKMHPHLAARYNLKAALLQLGPTGYPFEKFVAEVFRSLGYTVRTGVVLPGRCVRHEVDVLAQNDERVVFMECKFHARRSSRSNIKVALYIKARFDDLAHTLSSRASGRKVQGIIVTNTAFSHDAWRYTRCVSGLGLIQWRRPRGFSLAELIERAGVHPVTALTTLSHKQKIHLVRTGVVLCRDVTPTSLRSLHLSERKRARVLREAAAIVGQLANP